MIGLIIFYAMMVVFTVQSAPNCLPRCQYHMPHFKVTRSTSLYGVDTDDITGIPLVLCMFSFVSLVLHTPLMFAKSTLPRPNQVLPPDKRPS